MERTLGKRAYCSFFSVILLTAFFCSTAFSGETKPTHTAASRLPGEVKIVIWKSHYTLTLYKAGVPIKTYRTVFGGGFQDGDKRMVGDRRTPEGEFYICSMNHSKRFYKFMGLSYPSLKHAEHGLKSKLISMDAYNKIKQALEAGEAPPWDTRLGGAVGIHGITLDEKTPQKNVLARNWTDGCIALDNADIDEIFSAVSIGTPVTILP